MSRIGDKVKAARQAKNLSQKQLAKKLGVSESFISDVEIGRKIANQSIIDRLSKILGKEMNDITMSFEEQVYKKEDNKIKYSVPDEKKKVNEIWSDALSDVLKNVPVYNYDLNKPAGFKKLPVIGNKIEGQPKDKVVYLNIEDDDMIGFRIQKGDIALGHMTQQIDNNGIFLLEYKNTRSIRQVKKLDNSKVLLVSNRGSLRTETAEIKNLKIILKLDKVTLLL